MSLEDTTTTQSDAAPAADTSAASSATAAPSTPSSAGSQAPATSQVLNGDAGASAASTETKTAAEANADWRVAALQGLNPELTEKATKYLERRSSLADVLKSALAADGKISELSSRIKVPTGKDDDPKEVEAFRKALGVPEAADKYAMPTIEGVKWDDGQKADISEFYKAAHAANMSQAQTDAALKFFAQNQQQTIARHQATVAKAAEAAQEDLRAEWGREYKANVELANRWLAETFKSHMSSDDLGAFLSKRFNDGTALGENPGFVRGIVAMARDAADMGTLEIGDGKVTTSVNDRLSELYGYQVSNSTKYKSEAVQNEIKDLTARQLKLQARASK